MDEQTAREQVAETGRILLEKRLIARTWGNFSCLLDDGGFCITPSGLGYESMTPADVVRYDRRTGNWLGTRLPSSEKGIHAAAYKLLPDTGFVIHTHQIYASALGLTGESCLHLNDAQRRALGGIAWAKYGLPGTDMLRDHVADAMATGAHSVLMVNHGVLICGRDRAETIERVLLLEELCHRSNLGREGAVAHEDASALLERARSLYPTATLVQTEAVLALAELREPLYAQLDDMAQMIGEHIPAAADADDALNLLRTDSAVLLCGVGALIRGEDADDSEALRLLTHKAAVAALHCRAAGQDARLSAEDVLWMRRFYLEKYAGRKNDLGGTYG